MTDSNMFLTNVFKGYVQSFSIFLIIKLLKRTIFSIFSHEIFPRVILYKLTKFNIKASLLFKILNKLCFLNSCLDGLINSKIYLQSNQLLIVIFPTIWKLPHLLWVPYQKSKRAPFTQNYYEKHCMGHIHKWTYQIHLGADRLQEVS